MKTWTIGKRITVISGFLCVVIAALVIGAVLTIVKINHISLSLTDLTLPSIVESGQIIQWSFSRDMGQCG